MNEHFNNPEPLTVNNTAVIFVDNQVGLMTVVALVLAILLIKSSVLFT